MEHIFGPDDGLGRLPALVTDSTVGDFILYMVATIVIFFLIGLALYLFYFKRNAERDHQLALALVRERSQPARPYGGGADRYQPARAYDSRVEDVPEAVRDAYRGLESGRGDYRQDPYRASYRGAGESYAAPRAAAQPPRTARAVQRPPQPTVRAAPSDRTARNLEFLEDLLKPEGKQGARVRLEPEDRELLWEEAQEPEAAGGDFESAEAEDEEVLFVDEEPEEAPPAQPPPARRPARQQPSAPAQGEPVPAGAKDDFIEGPLALMLLQKDIEKAVKEAPSPARRQAAERGPVRSEGRPVFSKPLEEPTGMPAPGTEKAAPDMGELSGQLRSLAEKKRAEVRRLDEARKLRDAKRAEEDKRRQEEAAKKEELMRQQIRGMVRAGISEAQADEAPKGPPGPSPAELELKQAEEQRRLEEARRREERRRRWQELQKKHEAETIDDVLSKIGIK